jgi:lysyl-tRNA synthetase class II
MIPNAFRTLHCNAVRKEHIGQTVTLCGWVNSARDHGGVIFIDLRDREGLTQVVFRPEENAEVAAQSHELRDEDVLQIIGVVAARLSRARRTPSCRPAMSKSSPPNSRSSTRPTCCPSSSTASCPTRTCA